MTNTPKSIFRFWHELSWTRFDNASKWTNLQCFVPASSHDASVVRCFNPVNRFYRCVVLQKIPDERISSYSRQRGPSHQRNTALNVKTDENERIPNLRYLHSLVAVQIPHLRAFIT